MPLRYLKTKKQIQKKMLETKKSCSKYEKLAKILVESPIHLAWTVLELFNFSAGGGGGGGAAGGVGGGSKASLGLKRDKRLKTIWFINWLNFKKQINLTAVSEYPPTVSSASKALDTSTASSSATQPTGRYFPQVRISSSVEKIEYTDAGSEL